jgi:hypothetical protein
MPGEEEVAAHPPPSTQQDDTAEIEAPASVPSENDPVLVEITVAEETTYADSTTSPDPPQTDNDGKDDSNKESYDGKDGSDADEPSVVSQIQPGPIETVQNDTLEDDKPAESTESSAPAQGTSHFLHRYVVFFVDHITIIH